MKKIYLCGAALVFLSACTSIKTPSSVNGLNESQTVPSTQPNTKVETVKPGAVPNTFVLSGAIAAKSHKKGWSATADWKQSGPHTYQITLMGPMGSQAVRIEEQHGKVIYQEGAQTLSSSNGDNLLAKKTGIRLPVNSLYYWVRGIPAPGAIQSATRNSNGQLQMLKQSGYTIEYVDYMNAQPYVLPHKIRLFGPDLTVKLIIKKWQI